MIISVKQRERNKDRKKSQKDRLTYKLFLTLARKENNLKEKLFF